MSKSITDPTILALSNSNKVLKTHICFFSCYSLFQVTYLKLAFAYICISDKGWRGEVCP